jgi:hypothetical protein
VLILYYILIIIGGTMRKKIMSIILIGLFLTASTIKIQANNNQSPSAYGNSNGNIIDLVNTIDEELVYGYLESLVSYGTRHTGSDNCTRAGVFLYHQFKKMGLKTEIQSWEDRGFKSSNIIATLEGTDPLNNAEIIISAHYDTTKTSPGANDDGSGIAAVLAIAHVLSRHSFNQTIKFIAFSGEEVGLIGSFNYVKEAYLRGDNIYAVLNIDIIGWAETEIGGNILRFSYPDRSEWIAEYASEIGEKYYDTLNMHIECIPNYPGADHQAFVDYGYDGVWIVEHDGNKHGHSPYDNLTYINSTYLTKATKILCAILVEMARQSIDIQVIIKTPLEGKGYINNLPLLTLDFKKNYFQGYRGTTLIIGRTDASCEVVSRVNVKTVVFCIDDYFVFWDNKPPYEWKIEGKYLPLIGKHKLKVIAYTDEGKRSIDQMDLYFFTLSYQFGRL